MHFIDVAPRAGAWIEIDKSPYAKYCVLVAPRAGAWIEIYFAYGDLELSGSLPVRERGLKWGTVPETGRGNLSLPVRERGLKSRVCTRLAAAAWVAPRAGAWIEIKQESRCKSRKMRLRITESSIRA